MMFVKEYESQMDDLLFIEKGRCSVEEVVLKMASYKNYESDNKKYTRNRSDYNPEFNKNVEMKSGRTS